MDNIEYSSRVVAYADILGFKKLVEDSESNNHVDEEIIHTITSALQDIQETKDRLEAQVSVFSDSIAISCEKDAHAIFDIVYVLSILQLQLALKGVFLRGGITIGSIYHTEDRIFGPAMNRAVELEKLAIYPRIIAEKECYEPLINMQENSFNKGIVRSLFLKDRDGFYFINFLKTCWDTTSSSEGTFSRLGYIAKVIRERLKEYKRSKPYIHQKYEWLRLYLNSIVTAEGFDGKVDTEKLKEYRDYYGKLEIKLVDGEYR